jgi:hypothetical protein
MKTEKEISQLGNNNNTDDNDCSAYPKQRECISRTQDEHTQEPIMIIIATWTFQTKSFMS